jgi:hypothetical protein
MVDLSEMNAEELLELAEVARAEVGKRARKLCRPGARCLLLGNRGNWPQGQTATIVRKNDTTATVRLDDGAEWRWHLESMEIVV